MIDLILRTLKEIVSGFPEFFNLVSLFSSNMIRCYLFIIHTWILQGSGMQFITYAWEQIGFFLWNLCREFPQFHVNSFINEVLYRYLSITISCNIHYGDQAFIFYVEWQTCWEVLSSFFTKHVQIFFLSDISSLDFDILDTF